MIRFLAEGARYRVYALEESVYLKKKTFPAANQGFVGTDLLIAWHYGNPTSALILPDYIIVAGCGLTIFTLTTQVETQLFAEPDTIVWTNGLHRDDSADNLTFCYVDYSGEPQPRLCRMNALTQELSVLVY